MPGSNSLPETEQWIANIASETPNPSFWITRASTASHVAHLPAWTHSSSAHGIPSPILGKEREILQFHNHFPFGQSFFAIRSCWALLVLIGSSHTHSSTTWIHSTTGEYTDMRCKIFWKQNLRPWQRVTALPLHYNLSRWLAISFPMEWHKPQPKAPLRVKCTNLYTLSKSPHLWCFF